MNNDNNNVFTRRLSVITLRVNGTLAGQKIDTLTYSVYPNAYVSINGDRWTKHYYIGSERIASRTGTLGVFNNLNADDNYSAGHGIQSVSYDDMMAVEEDSIAAMYERFGVPYDVQHASTRGCFGHLYIPITRDNDDTAETASQNRNHPHPMDGGQVYYFHRDHLGGTLSVTDSLGAYVQQVEYTPWGEVFVEPKGDSILTTPVLFNGKELDEETGLYYYGARYYDPKMSVWYSVDRFAEKYPFASPYNYSLYNPLAIIDENGDSIKAISKTSGLILQNEIHNSFYGSRFDKLNSLFQLSNDGRTMKGIRRKDFAAAIRDLTSDEKALAIGYYKAINSKEVHYVDFVRQTDYLNQMTRSAYYEENWKTGKDVDAHTGGGINKKYNNGSFTIIVVNSIVNIDYVYAANGHHYSRFSTSAELLAHELLGHGYGRSVNSKTSRHLDAIQLKNLYWRVRGYINFYRDGTNHGKTGSRIFHKSEATGIPLFLRHF